MKTLKNRKLTKMKIKLLAIVLLLAATSIKAQQVDFSGNWTRNTKKCDAGDLSINSIPVGLSVKQDTRQITITRISKNYKGDTTAYMETLKSDGSSASTVIKSNLDKKANVSWSPDKKTLTETADYADDSGNPVQKAKELWALDDNGKTLQIQLTLMVNGQDHVLTEVYDRN
ncbi:MAG TPA: hypothetical protein VFE53_02885 [Mucilaginibacter sp.]|jgi:hypothetical protein|nr:hypothetical protein [Mucilaginibacter sp.]